MILYQLKDGYRYNSDTLMLYDFALSLNLKGEILEIGTGCGVLGLLLKRDLKDANLTLMDIQKENIMLCKENSQINGIECEILEGDFSSFKSSKRFDTIISNPPYYHDGVIKSQNPHLSISRYSKNLSLENLIINSNTHLKPNGNLVLCYDAKQLMDIIVLFHMCKLRLTRLKFIHPKVGKSAKVALIEAKKNSRSLCEIEPAFYLSDENGYTKQASEIFKSANLQSMDFKEI